MRTLIALATASLSLAACTTTDIATPEQAAPPAAALAADTPGTPTDATSYVAMAGAGDLFEIQSAQIALARTQNADVRALAQMLLTHHQQTTATLTEAARAAGIAPPPPALMPQQQQMIDQLQAATAPEFDRAFLREQVTAHQMALALHQTYATRGDTPALRTAAASAVPVIQQHLDRAEQLSR